jgi:hypothetical protein
MTMMRFRHAPLRLVLAVGALLSSSAARSAVDSSYTIEFAPLLGINLPYDLWGAQTLSVYGLRTGYRLPNPTGVAELGLLYHTKEDDKAYTIDAAYRHEVYSGFLNGFFVIGLHYSYYDLTTDYDSDGACVPKNCRTDSGSHSGLTYGGGLLVPVGETEPLRLGVRYYKSPQTWLLLEAAWGFRF